MCLVYVCCVLTNYDTDGKLISQNQTALLYQAALIQSRSETGKHSAINVIDYAK